MSISKTVVTCAEMRLDITMCSAVFFRIGSIGTISTRSPGWCGETKGAGAGAGAAAVAVPEAGFAGGGGAAAGAGDVEGAAGGGARGGGGGPGHVGVTPRSAAPRPG